MHPPPPSPPLLPLLSLTFLLSLDFLSHSLVRALARCFSLHSQACSLSPLLGVYPSRVSVFCFCLFVLISLPLLSNPPYPPSLSFSHTLSLQQGYQSTEHRDSASVRNFSHSYGARQRLPVCVKRNLDDECTSLRVSLSLYSMSRIFSCVMTHANV